MKQFTITIESDEHCEAIARSKGYQDEVANPDFEHLPLEIPNPDYNSKLEISEDNPRRISNPDLKPQMIPNPLSAEEHLADLIRADYDAVIHRLGLAKAEEQLQASKNTLLADYLSKGAIIRESSK